MSEKKRGRPKKLYGWRVVYKIECIGSVYVKNQDRQQATLEVQNDYNIEDLAAVAPIKRMTIIGHDPHEK